MKKPKRDFFTFVKLYLVFISPLSNIPDCESEAVISGFEWFLVFLFNNIGRWKALIKQSQTRDARLVKQLKRVSFQFFITERKCCLISLAYFKIVIICPLLVLIFKTHYFKFAFACSSGSCFVNVFDKRKIVLINVKAVLLFGSETWWRPPSDSSRSCKCSSVGAWGTFCGFGGLDEHEEQRSDR